MASIAGKGTPSPTKKGAWCQGAPAPGLRFTSLPSSTPSPTRGFPPGLMLPLHIRFSQQMAASVPWACCAVLAAAAAAVYTQKHSPQGECLGELLASSSRTVHESLLAHGCPQESHWCTAARSHMHRPKDISHVIVISRVDPPPHSHTWIVTR